MTFTQEGLKAEHPDLVVLSPGPGRPVDFALQQTIASVLEHHLPLFGVCLGLQGIVEFFGGTLDTLNTPMHGKPSNVRVLGGEIFAGLPKSFKAGRYHSLFASRTLPDDLLMTAEADDGVIMGVEHREQPIAAVQFHPESILSLDDDLGRRLVGNVVEQLAPTKHPFA